MIMKLTSTAFLFSALLATTSLAQTATDTNAVNSARTLPAASARDGFTLRGTEIVVTQNGVTTKVDHEMKLPNGLRVQANGNITRADGSSTALRPNQILTLDGTIQDVLLDSNGVAPLSSVDPGPAPKSAVGLAAKDGISVSGTDLLLTRNGVTEKVTADVRLSNGIVAKPDGTVILNNGNRITLRSDQVLDLNGVLRDVPVANSPTLPGTAPGKIQRP